MGESLDAMAALSQFRREEKQRERFEALAAPRKALSEAAVAHSANVQDLGLLESLCRAAAVYEQARQKLAAKPSPLPTGQKSKNDPGYVIVPFGRSKGQYLDDCKDGDLRWLRDAVQDSLDDPAKERYRGKNAELLDAIVAVLERRGAA